MWLLPRLRYHVARRPYLYWIVAGACALLVAARVHGAELGARQRAAAWGSTRTVWVADIDTAPGTRVHASAHRFPVAMVPSAAITTTVGDSVAARSVTAGQILQAADLAGAQTPPPAWVVLAVPVDHAPHLVVGDAVAVLRNGTHPCDGIISGTPSDRLEVAMPAECAAAVSAEISNVVVARRASPTYGATDDRSGTRFGP